MKTERKLTKKELRLIARIFAGSMLIENDMCGDFDEDQGEVIASEVYRIGKVLIGKHPHFWNTEDIEKYVKSLRK